MTFQYYEVRPVIEHNGTCEPFDTEQEWADRLEVLRDAEADYASFWSIYGRYDDGTGALLTQCVGDFQTKADAFAILNAILDTAVLARDALDAGAPSRTADDLTSAIRSASAMLEDMINQSSNEERL